MMLFFCFVDFLRFFFMRSRKLILKKNIPFVQTTERKQHWIPISVTIGWISLDQFGLITAGCCEVRSSCNTIPFQDCDSLFT